MPFLMKFCSQIEAHQSWKVTVDAGKKIKIKKLKKLRNNLISKILRTYKTLALPVQCKGELILS